MTSGLAGQILTNRYSLEVELRPEGTGTIYRATDRQHHSRSVLAKVLDLTIAGAGEGQRFDRGAAVLKALRQQAWSPRLIDRGATASLKFLILENMKGETLADHLRKHKTLPLCDALPISIDVATILEALHARGLMQGDVRPPHIFLEEGLKGIRLLNYDRTLPTNLSQLKKAGLSAPEVPSPPETPYWPPERLRQPADARHDLYSLAVVIYEMVSGKQLRLLPAKGAVHTSVDIVNADSSINTGLRKFFTQALHPEIAKRFQNAGEMCTFLKELLRQTQRPVSERPRPIPVLPRRSRLHPNDVQLVRVYPREKAGRILEETIPGDVEFEVVVEAKAGETIHGDRAKYFIQVVVRDLTDFTVVQKCNLEGNLGYEPWHEPVLLHAFPVPAQGPVKEYHVYEVLASLHVGTGNPNVSFTKSPLFIIYKA